MLVKFETVLDGVNRYIDSEIYPGLNDLQEFLARLVIGRINQSADGIKSMLMTNGFARTLCLIDTDGMVDIDRLCADVRRELERKGSMEVEIPMVGKIKFTASDVDVLRSHIVRG